MSLSQNPRGCRQPFDKLRRLVVCAAQGSPFIRLGSGCWNGPEADGAAANPLAAPSQPSFREALKDCRRVAMTDHEPVSLLLAWLILSTLAALVWVLTRLSVGRGRCEVERRRSRPAAAPSQINAPSPFLLDRMKPIPAAQQERVKVPHCCII